MPGCVGAMSNPERQQLSACGPCVRATSYFMRGSRAIRLGGARCVLRKQSRYVMCLGSAPTPMLWLHESSGQSVCRRCCAKWGRGWIPRWLGLGPSCACGAGRREVEVVRVYPLGRSVKLGQKASCHGLGGVDAEIKELLIGVAKAGPWAAWNGVFEPNFLTAAITLIPWQAQVQHR
jgi:hypothetical protein